MIAVNRRHLGVKAAGIALAAAAAGMFLAMVFGAFRNDWAWVGSFVAFFIGLVIFAVGWFME
jgi:hypothetical protein